MPRKSPKVATVPIEEATAADLVGDNLYRFKEATANGGELRILREQHGANKRRTLDVLDNAAELTEDVVALEKLLIDKWGGPDILVQHILPGTKEIGEQVLFRIDPAVKPKLVASSVAEPTAALGSRERTLELENARLQGMVEERNKIQSQGGGLSGLDQATQLITMLTGIVGLRPPPADPLTEITKQQEFLRAMKDELRAELGGGDGGLGSGWHVIEKLVGVVETHLKENPHALDGLTFGKRGTGGAAPARPAVGAPPIAPVAHSAPAPASAPAQVETMTGPEHPGMKLARQAVQLLLIRYDRGGSPETAGDVLIEELQSQVPGPMFDQLVTYAADPQMVERAPSLLGEFFPDLPTANDPKWKDWIAQVVAYLHQAALDLNAPEGAAEKE